MVVDENWMHVVEISVWVSFVIGIGACFYSFVKRKGPLVYPIFTAAIALVAIVGLMNATGEKDSPETTAATVFDKIKIVEPQLTLNQVKRSELHPDLFEVYSNGKLRYVLGDDYVLRGDILDLNSGENLSAKQQGAYRNLQGLSEIEEPNAPKQASQPDANKSAVVHTGSAEKPEVEAPNRSADSTVMEPGGQNFDVALAILANDVIPDEMTVVYPARGEEKHQITIFSDITCPVCQRNHEDYGKFQDLGVTIRAALFPRRGMNAPESEIMSKVLCAESMEDRRSLLDRAYAGETLEAEAMCNNEYLENIRNIAVSQESGLAVESTPTLMSANGIRVDGYPRENPVETIMAMLESRK